MARTATVRNVTRDAVVADQCRIAQGLAQRVLGLHLLPRLEPGQGLFLPDSTTIDTMFMRYPIDLVFMDRSRQVTRIVPGMRPWRMVMHGGGGRHCLELPAGAAAASGTRVGDQLAFDEPA